MAKFVQSFWNHFTTRNFILELYLFKSTCIILTISSLFKRTTDVWSYWTEGPCRILYSRCSSRVMPWDHQSSHKIMRCWGKSRTLCRTWKVLSLLQLLLLGVWETCSQRWSYRFLEDHWHATKSLARRTKVTLGWYENADGSFCGH